MGVDPYRGSISSRRDVGTHQTRDLQFESVKHDDEFEFAGKVWFVFAHFPYAIRDLPPLK